MIQLWLIQNIFEVISKIVGASFGLCASFGIFNCCFRVFHSIFIVFHFIFIFRDLYLLFLKAIHGDSKTQFKNSASIL